MLHDKPLHASNNNIILITHATAITSIIIVDYTNHAVQPIPVVGLSGPMICPCIYCLEIN